MTQVAPHGQTPAWSRFQAHADKLALEASVTTRERSSVDEWLSDKLVRIMEAGTVEEINKLAEEGGLLASQNLGGRTFTVTDFAISESADEYRKNSLLKKYAIVAAVDRETGEEIVFQGGGDTFVAQLIAMRDRYGFPFTGTIITKPTGNGTLVLWRMHVPKQDG